MVADFVPASRHLFVHFKDNGQICFTTNEAGVRILGYCRMTNHVHLIAVPAREESLSILFRRVHGRYAQYYNARFGRSGHLWQNRFFACMLGSSHLWSALAYVERNPVRAGMVEHAADYSWSSAKAHLDCTDSTGLLGMEWWRGEAPRDWSHMLTYQEEEIVNNLRGCTYAGRPFGEESFVTEMAEKFGRFWIRGRPRKTKNSKALDSDSASQDKDSKQFQLF